MWLNAGRLEHVLSPRAYCEESQHRLEAERIFDAGWFLTDDESPPAARSESIGQLVFATRCTEARPLSESFPARTRELIEKLFGEPYRLIGSWRLRHRANWKVPIENAVESYHVPRVHPHSFGEVWCTESADTPGEPRHELGDGYSTYEDVKPSGSLAFRALMRSLRAAPRYRYLHHHAFPSLTFAATDVLSFVQAVYPTSPTTSASVVRAFLHEGDTLSRALTHRLLAIPSRQFVERILREDDRIFPDIQAGLQASPHRGVLGACEERVYHFQRWLAERLSSPAHADAVDPQRRA